MNDVPQISAALSEQHQFILACVGHVVSLVSMIFLYHSSPRDKKPSPP